MERAHGKEILFFNEITTIDFFIEISFKALYTLLLTSMGHFPASI